MVTVAFEQIHDNQAVCQLDKSKIFAASSGYFSIIEVLQGNYQQALAHLEGIIHLLNEATTWKRDKSQEILVTDVEEILRPVISRSDVEASVFVSDRSPLLSLPPPIQRSITFKLATPLGLSDLEEAGQPETY